MPPPMNPANAKLKVELEIVPKTGQTSAAMQQLEERARRLGAASRAVTGGDPKLNAAAELGINTAGIARDQALQAELRRIGLSQQETLRFLREAKAQGTITGSGRKLLDTLEARQEESRSSTTWTELASKAQLLTRILSGVSTAIGHFGDVSLTASQRMMMGFRDTVHSVPIVGDLARLAGGIGTEIFFGGDRRDMNRALEERVNSQYSAIVQQGAFRKEEIERNAARARYESQAMGRFGGTRGYSARLRDSLGISRVPGLPEPLAALFDATIGDSRSPFGMAANSFLGLSQAAKPEAIREAERQAELARRPLFVAQQEFADARFGRSAAQQQVEQAQARLDALRQPKGQKAPPSSTFVPTAPWMTQLESQNETNAFSESARMVRENQALEDLKRAQERLERSIRTEQEKGLAVESKKYELNQKTLDIRRAELKILRDRQAQAESNLTEFGAMNNLQRYNLLEAARQFRERGLEGTPEDAINMLKSNGMTREMVIRAEQESARNSPELGEIERITGAPNLDKIIRERGEVERAIEALDEKYQKLFREQVEKLYETFAGPLKTLLDNMSLGLVQMLQNSQTIQTFQKLMGQ